jgi:hypothetical protein
MSDKNGFDGKFLGLVSLVESHYPIPVISLSMKRAQVFESLNITGSIYNTDSVLKWLTTKVFSADISLNDDDVEYIERKLKRVRTKYIMDLVEEALEN